MFDVNGGEMAVLAGIALVVLGPDKLPAYAAKASHLLRQLREMADSAKDEVRGQLGPEFDDVDWQSLDPRRFDPRQIVRDALNVDRDADDRDDDDREDEPQPAPATASPDRDPERTGGVPPIFEAT